MADLDDDDEFGLDDALDHLPDNDLYQLEHNALLSTQHNRAPLNAVRNQGLGDEGSFASERTLLPNRPPSDYGLDDEDVIDLDDQPFAVQQKYRHGNTYNAYLGQDHEDTGYGAEEGDESYRTAVEQPMADVAGLRALLSHAQNENLNLRRAIEETTSTVQSKSGENAILRQKLDKLARDNNQKESTMRQLYQEQLAKQKAETERIKSENQKVITNSRFLEHDLALEAGKAKQLQRNLKAGGVRDRASPASTPKRNRVLPFRDGFDDEDLVMLSPSKARSKPSTPKGGTKRKRTVNDQSPMQPPQLPLSEPRPAPSPLQQPFDVGHAADLQRKLSKEENKVQFIQNLLNYPTGESEERVFEALTRYAFPSEPGKKLSSIVFDQLSTRSYGKPGVEMSSQFCGLLLSVWDRCLVEAYYKPIALLVDTLQFVLESEGLAFIRTFTERIVPSAIATSDIVAIPIARASIKKGPTTQPTPETQSGTIDVFACLTLLQTIAQACVPFTEAITKFWRQMKFDFVLLMLMKAQPLPQITLMLQLLQTAAHESTFGAILGDEEGVQRQAKRESDTIDRLTNLLFESPKPAEGEELHPGDMLELRIEVLSVLAAMCVPDHCGRALAQHRYAVGRLFKFLHDSIANLYNHTSGDHALEITIVNMSMRIIYHLVTHFSNIVDVRTKLATVQGGAHMHLIALTRLAFSERVWFEEGVQTEVMDMAHQLLDEHLSPDEGEALLQMFSSGNSES